MSRISNRLYVTALEDGTTLHANLACDMALTQAWNGSVAVPDWTIAANQPTIYLTLLSGATLVAPAAGYKWYYNNTEITAQNTNFQITTKSVTYAGQTVTMPALKIISNLASSSNVDIDSITFKGSVDVSGAGIDFACTAQIRISSMNGSGYVGTINFLNGISDITEKGQTITMQGILYSGETGAAVDGVTTQWYLNDSQQGTAGTTISGRDNSYQVTEADVVDHATVRCDFFDTSSNLLGSAYAGIDDMQDPEFLYIQYNGANGNAASLRSGETASFQMWVGTRDDPSVMGGASTPTYGYMKIMILNGAGEPVIGGSLATGIPASDANGWRDLSSLISQGKFPFTPNYTTVSALGKNITGIIVASTAPFT